MAAPRGSTLQVKDFDRFLATMSHTDRAMNRAARAEIRNAGSHVQADAAIRFRPIDARSAAGYRVRVRRRGVAVEQSLRRTTGKHPEYGVLQMRKALIPAADENEEKTRRALEAAYDLIAARFNHT
jgi:hypothetical protein